MSSVIEMLAKTHSRYNKGRNRILTAAVCLCILTLTIVFGIASGKIEAEYLKAIREAGTTASACIEKGDKLLYSSARELPYVKEAGRRATVGSISQNKTGVSGLCSLQAVDQNAWEYIQKPAYTDVQGHYPTKEQEMMLPVDVLKEIGIEQPKEGMKLSFTVTFGFFEQRQEHFALSGWYQSYVKDRKEQAAYISEGKAASLGCDLEQESDILICPKNRMSWEETEQKLYEDLVGERTDIIITVQNPFAYEAFRKMAGGYGMAGVEALIILGGMFFLVYNVLCLSMAEDIRQMGLLNTIGTTMKQIRSIYFRQIFGILIRGTMLGTLCAIVLLVFVLPRILGNSYMETFGRSVTLQIFQWKVLALSVCFAVLVTGMVSGIVIYRMVNLSCLESMNYVRETRKKKRKRKAHTWKYQSERSADGELWYMAWQNVKRYRGRFVMTVLSLFLGIEMFLCALVITRESDYSKVIEKRPDFLIAGTFSKFGQEEGYGLEYKSQDAQKDPMETTGDATMLLYDNESDGFSPISTTVRNELLGIDGVNKKASCILEGAYMNVSMARKAYLPLENVVRENEIIKEGVGFSTEYEMVDTASPYAVQILNEKDLEELERYVDRHHIPADMESVRKGMGVLILHDHQIGRNRGKEIEEGIGEPVYFKALPSEEKWEEFAKSSEKERGEMIDTGMMTGQQSEVYGIAGYLDSREEDFPDLARTWHNSEGMFSYLMSEKGFQKLPTTKKTLYMELEAEKGKETLVKKEVQNILAKENQRRAEIKRINWSGEEVGEAGIFCIYKSELLAEASSYIQGNRILFGSISAVLLIAGLMNFANVMITSILTRKQDFLVMEKIGMTKRQKRKLLVIEGMYYVLIVAVLLLTVGVGMLYLIDFCVK